MNRWPKPAFALALVAYFFAVSRDTWRVGFSADEMMAIHTYWHPSPWRLLTSQFLMWRGYFRPLGALFYVPNFLLFGLNPVPYHIVLWVLLLLGVWQMYRLARAGGCPELSAFVVALIACYHGGLSNLYYQSVFVFDVLCGIFYFASFAYYARIRSSGRLLRGRETALFLLLYLCTLNSKEMAVTMPVMLLAYEWLFHTPPRLEKLVGWIRGPGRIICWAGLLNVVYIWGKAYGQYGLMKQPGYSPQYSWERIVDFQERYIGDLFYQWPRVSGVQTCLIWLVVTYLCWRRPRPILRFCWFWIVVTPLPIEFLAGRDQACLYVPLAGWAILAATLLIDFLPAATRVASGEWLFRGMDATRIRTILAAAGILLWAGGSWAYKETAVTPILGELDPRLAQVLAEFRAVNPQVPPASKVVLLDDPFHTFDSAFVAELWFRDRKTRVILNQITPLKPEEIAQANAVFTWTNGKLVRVTEPLK